MKYSKVNGNCPENRIIWEYGSKSDEFSEYNFGGGFGMPGNEIIKMAEWIKQCREDTKTRMRDTDE